VSVTWPQELSEPSVPAWTQPVAGLQLSVVHGLPSLQFGAEPPWQVPPPHTSFVVHAFPSLQGAVLLV
jgi:hypothetical protein